MDAKAAFETAKRSREIILEKNFDGFYKDILKLILDEANKGGFSIIYRFPTVNYFIFDKIAELLTNDGYDCHLSNSEIIIHWSM
ncbi:hypothetical protein [Bacillus haynesii]|uniref:hypothetical protein n=1 Tax=Bacillus haynesii TaxID=1925021 RepID=UPI0022811BA3|nr:hypothetical protein [Bacillus haynesii]MCY8408995.1 hypothetical protein [Bacillus haynesii]MCY8433456.1 hypothetical protein [Bacillus haynesii]MCY8557864.1 hypothetical protein [Bacillus haynesii]MEC0709606.1 hypothetical protein [Bacillus haynesii]MEC0738760.1 hypothetical protein [Bacillus haynesii]